MDIQLIGLVLAAMLAAVLVIAAFAVLAHAATRTRLSLFPLLYPLVLANTAIATLTSTRDFSSMWVVAAELERSPIASWATRLGSLVLLAGALIEVVRFLSGRGNGRIEVRGLIAALVLFVLAASTATSLFGAHPYFNYTLLYAPMFCLGAICMADADAVRALRWARDASLAFLSACWLLLPVVPKVMLNTSYEQGLINGLPRLAGLATHEVSLATMTSIFMALLLAFPYVSRRMNVFAWSVTLATLLLSQSKNAWAVSLFIYAVFVAYDRRLQGHGRFALRPSGFSILAWGSVVVLTSLALVAMLVADLPLRMDKFLHTTAGINLLTFTGRDLIWEEAMRAWREHPWFGYGIELFSPEYRAQIGMLYATHGHNQVFDLLGRSGSVGLAGFLVFFWVLWWRAVRNALPTGGLSLVLIVSLTIRCVTDVPISSGPAGYETLPYLLLLIVISRSPVLQIYAHRQRVLQARTGVSSSGAEAW
jgi:hypothetical protein